MQKIFSQGLRFKDENGNDYTKWKQVTIAEITSYVSSKRVQINITKMKAFRVILFTMLYEK